MSETQIFGAPGIEPRWTSSAKDGVGTAYHSSSSIWFTLSHGIVNEIYFPHVDVPNTRDLQFLVTDGETFCHEERRDLLHCTEYPEKNALLYRITNSDSAGRYRLVKEILADPHSPVLLMHTRLEIDDPALRGKLRVFALLAPHLKGTGKNNTAAWSDIGGRKLLHAHREDIHLVMGGTPDFTRRSVGYVGSSDGWQDLMANFKMDWEFERAEDGNVAVMAEVDLSAGMEFTLGVGFGRNGQSATTQLLQALAGRFDEAREKYVAQWQRARSKIDLEARTGDGGSMLRLSQCVLLAHEDKTFQGAFVASLSIPWGDTKDDRDLAGYHLVWTRDMVQIATALLACGHTESPLRALIWLSCVQAADGSLPQNSYVTGEAYRKAMQLDEVAWPVLLAWRLREADALRQFDPWPLVSRAARYLILNGPVTMQERWEENSGYSPSTLAVVIAALVCAAEFARETEGEGAADFLRDYADWLSAHVEVWTVTHRGELVPEQSRHYIRITPADLRLLTAEPDPNGAEIVLANGAGRHAGRNVVSGDFLQLVRLGIRAPDDPVIVDSVAVIDHILKRDLPQGSCWRRYNHDAYGDKADGGAFDGTGIGRCWPLLTGERGHYELAAGRDPLPFITTLEKFANDGGMLAEQLWDDDDLPGAKKHRGQPTGAAMPLCWAHAEYVTLVRSCRDGACFDRIAPAYQRYVAQRPSSGIAIWTMVHQPQRIARGKTLRIITEKPAMLRWSADGWATVNDSETREAGLGCWCADLSADRLAQSARVVFTFFWHEGWAGENYSVTIGDAN